MSLTDALTCSMANCQYGCDVVKGEIRCRCPSPGLQLAPDGRTCVGKLMAINMFFHVVLPPHLSLFSTCQLCSVTDVLEWTEV